MSKLEDLGYNQFLERSRFDSPLTSEPSGEPISTAPLSPAGVAQLVPDGTLDYVKTNLAQIKEGEDMQTEDFVSGSTGWRIKGDGTVEFNDAVIRGTIYATAGEVGGWSITTGYIYSLQSGTPTSSPNDGIVMASGDEAILVYEDTAKRLELGYLSAGVYGLKVYDSGGSNVLFELSDTQTIISGWTTNQTTLAVGTNIILDSTNKAISINDATFGNSGIQLQYNSGTPRAYIGDGSTYFFNFDGTNISWGANTTSLDTAGKLTTTSADIGGWDVVSGYIYNLVSGTPTSSPNDGVVLASGNEGIIVYEDTAKRAELGYLSSGIYGVRVFDTGGSNVIFEASDTQQKMAGWYFTTTTLADNATAASANVLIDSGNSLIRLGPTAGTTISIDGGNQKIESSDYVSGYAGAGFHLSAGLLETGNIACRGIIRTAVFQKDVISAVGGNVAILPSDILATTMTALDSANVVIEGNETFANSDILRIKDGTDDEWMTVTDASGAPTYVVTRDSGSAYGADSNPTWQKGASVVNYGASGEGGVYMTSSETNAPYLSVFDHAGAPWTTINTRLRLGNLNGYLGYSSDTYGIGIGSSSASQANITFDSTNGIRLRTATENKIVLDNSGNAFFGGAITIGDGSSTSGTITLNHYATGGDTYIGGGTFTASSWTCNNGFLFGIDDSDSDKVKGYMGDGTSFWDWNVTTANKLTITDANISGTLSVGTIPALPSDTNLVGYWSFDEGSGTTALDSTANGNNLTITGCTYTDGVSGTALNFANGTDQVFVSPIPSEIRFDGSEAFSFEVWGKTAAAGDDNIIDTRKSGYLNNFLLIRVNNSKFECITDGLTSGGATITGSTSIDDNVLHHLVFTRSAAGVMNVYVDGDVDATPVTDSAVGAITDANSDLRIGKHYSITTSTWVGDLDEPKFYNKELSANEVKALNANRGGSISGVKQTGAEVLSGWSMTSGYIYSLQSGTPTSSPSDGIVIASGNEGVICYEDTAKRTELGYLSSGVYGLKVYDSGGSNVIFEASDTQQVVGGWNFDNTYLYGLTSGTPTSSPTDGMVLKSGGSSVLTVYEDAAKRVELGYLSSGVYGLKGYDSGGSNVLFELSDTQSVISGWTIGQTTLANGTNIILDASNKAISINDATFGNSGIQLQYNSGTPRFYAGDGTANNFFKFDGTDVDYSGKRDGITQVPLFSLEYGENLTKDDSLSLINSQAYNNTALEVHEDSYIDANNPATNYSTAASLKCISAALGPGETDILLRFNATGAPYYMIEYDPVISCDLHIYVNTVTGAGDIEVRTITDAFTMATVNWNNKPAQGVAIDSITVNSTGWKTISLDFSGLGDSYYLMDSGLYILPLGAATNVEIDSDNGSNPSYIDNIYYLARDGKVYKSTALYQQSVDEWLGFCSETGNSGTTGVEIQTYGVLSSDTAKNAVDYYLSDTLGAIDTSAGTISKKIGRGVPGTYLIIKNDND